MAGRELRYTLKRFYEMQKGAERLEKRLAERGDRELQEQLAATQERILPPVEVLQAFLAFSSIRMSDLLDKF